jgi:hypothetical protein
MYSSVTLTSVAEVIQNANASVVKIKYERPPVEDQNAENARRPADVPEGLDSVDPEVKRAAARLKAKESLIASLAGGDFSNQQTRVAHILNLHPAARNSDVWG